MFIFVDNDPIFCSKNLEILDEKIIEYLMKKEFIYFYEDIKLPKSGTGSVLIRPNWSEDGQFIDLNYNIVYLEELK